MTRHEIAHVLAPVADVPKEQIPDVLGELRRLDAILYARLVCPEPEDELVTAEVAARLLGVSSDTVYRRADDYPFTVRHAGRTVRFSRAGIQRWLAAHQEGR